MTCLGEVAETATEWTVTDVVARSRKTPGKGELGLGLLGFLRGFQPVLASARTGLSICRHAAQQAEQQGDKA